MAQQPRSSSDNESQQASATGHFRVGAFKLKELGRVIPLGPEALDNADVLGAQRLQALRAEFDLPDSDLFRGHFVCAYRRPGKPGIMQGELFLWDSRLVFRASVVGVIKHKHIAWVDVISIRRKTSLRMPNTIGLDFMQCVLDRNNTLHSTTSSVRRGESPAPGGARSSDGGGCGDGDGDTSPTASSVAAPAAQPRQPQHVVLTHFFFSSREKAFDIMVALWRVKRPELADQALETASMTSAQTGADSLRLNPPRGLSRTASGGLHRRQRSLQRLAVPVDDGAHLALSAMLPWVVVAPSLAPVAPDLRLCSELAVPCRPRQAMEVLLADMSGFLVSGTVKGGNSPLSMSKWEPSSAPGVTAERVFRFNYVSDGPLGKIRSTCIQLQFLSVHLDGSASFWYEQRMPDLPAGVGKAFHVLGRWDFAPTPATTEGAATAGGAGAGGAAGSQQQLQEVPSVDISRPGSRSSLHTAGTSPSVSSSAAMTHAASASEAAVDTSAVRGASQVPSSAAATAGVDPTASKSTPAERGLLKLDSGLRNTLRAANGILRGSGTPPLSPSVPPAADPAAAAGSAHASNATLLALAMPAAAAEPTPAADTSVHSGVKLAGGEPISRATSMPAPPPRGCVWRVYLAVRFERGHILRSRIENNTYAITGKVLEQQACEGLQWIAEPDLRVPLHVLMPPPPPLPAPRSARHVRAGSGGRGTGGAALPEGRPADAVVAAEEVAAEGSVVAAARRPGTYSLGEGVLLMLVLVLVGAHLLLMWRMAEVHAQLASALMRLAEQRC